LNGATCREGTFGGSMRIAVIEDEKDLASLLAFQLEKEGYQVLTAHDGKTGYELVSSELPDLVLLDLMLPIISGVEVCKLLKKQKSTQVIPVIMLTAKGEEIDRVIGFEVGADDYVTKPFSLRELLLRIKVAVRRTNREEQDERIIVIGPVVIDTSRCLVTIDGEEAVLTSTEYKLLCALAESRGRVQTRDHLLRSVWGHHSGTDTRTVDSHITRIRTKLGSCGDFIKTVRGFGYKMEGE
jgi:two-component system phosphate regulon response regulator PhoB